MKFKTLVLLIVLDLIACNFYTKTESKTVKSDSTNLNFISGIENTLSERQQLINELKKLSSAIENRKIKSITDYFTFPLADTVITIYELNPEFDNDRKRNSNFVTIEMFKRNFNSIYDHFNMEEFAKLFKSIDIDSLIIKDQLTSEKHFKNQKCYRIYELNVNEREITLQYGTNSEPLYRNNHPDEEMICLEYTQIWKFIFDGQKLYFKKQFLAG